MPPDIMAGLFASAGPPGAPAIGLTAAPPGSTGLAALFAALLAQSGGPPVQTANALPAQIKSDPLKAATLPSFPLLPNTKLPITNQITMRPITPQKANVSAETQNAMDTSPVSVSPKVKTAENKPVSELPLSIEVKAVAPLPLPAFPGILITPTLPLLPVKAASPKDTVTSAPQALAMPQAMAAASVPSAVASLPLPIALPKTFLLPVVQKVAMTEPITAAAQSQPVLVVEAVALVRENKPVKQSMPVPIALPAAQVKPYVIAPQGLSVPVKAILEPLPLPAIAETNTVPLTLVKPAAVTLPQAVTPPQAAAPVTPVITLPQVVTLPLAVMPTTAAITPNIVPTQAAQPEVVKQVVKLAATISATLPDSKPQTGSSTPPPVSLSEPGKITPAVAALLPAAPALPVAVAQAIALKQGAKLGPLGKPLVEGNESSPAPALLPTETPQPKIALKTLAVPADNNTRISNVKAQPAPLGKPALVEVRLQVVGKRSERVVPSALPIITPSPAAPTNPAGTVTTMPLTQTERAEMIRQVAEGVQTIRPSVKAGTAEQMTLQLHPKDWGQLQITVKVVPSARLDAAQAQAVTAHIVAETPQVKAALENGSSDLRHALRAAGLHLERLTVTVQAITGSGQAGTASSGGHHLMNGGNGGLGQGQPESKSSTGSGPPQSGPTFSSAWAGHSQDRRQDGQSQTAYSGTYSANEPERDEIPDRESTPLRSAVGQLDMRA